MQPRNSSCTDTIFNHIEIEEFPSNLNLNTISLIVRESVGK